MHIVGRRNEQKKLHSIVASGKPEFVVVYGRRRVGKTYLVGEFFGDGFAFRAAGLAKGSMAEQLSAFGNRLREYGLMRKGTPKTWLEAFEWLKELLSSKKTTRFGNTNRKIVFIDEMPWFDTPRSGFRTALEHFWNGWGCTQESMVLIVCGSATSWIVDNLLESTGGLYDRVTRIIDLQPFSLSECQEFNVWRDIGYSPRQVAESYMVFGGIPYYLDLQERGLSLAQNVDELLFKRGGQLVAEFDRIFATLFRNPGPYMDIVKKLATKRSGMTRDEIMSGTGISGGKLTKTLKSLELCGFIRSFRNFNKRKKGIVYQLIDPFTLFYLTFVEAKRFDSWMGFIGTPAYHAWGGLSFEMLCLAHVEEIKSSLGISGVQTNTCAWRSETSSPGAQIDLLIDRRDDVINICEMKYTDGLYAMTATDEHSLRNKASTFRLETGTKKAVHPILVTLDGASHNMHYNSIVLNEVIVTDWFK